MGGIILFLGFAWIFWHVAIRKVYISYKYRIAKPIPFPVTLSDETIFNLIQEKINYPEKLHIFWNQDGVIIIQGKYGQHALSIKENGLYVERDGSKDGKNIEEAEVLDAYIRKIFDVNAPVNPYLKWKKLNSHSKKYRWIHISVFGIFLLGAILGIYKSSVYNSANISDSYLPQYSETITVGYALDSFFENGKWSKHSEGGIEYVDYSGTCIYDEDTANVTIRFWHSDTEFKVSTVFVNGEEISTFLQADLFDAIYNR